MYKAWWWLFGAIATVAFLPQARSVDVTVNRTYDGDGVKIEGLGVCDITAEKVDCWDMDGAHSPALTARVAAALSSRNYGDTSFRFGRKNRWIVIHQSGNRSNSFQTPGGGYGSTTQLYEPNEMSLDLVRFAFEGPDKETAVTAELYGLPGPAPIDVAFREGTKALFDGFEVEIGPTKERKPTKDEIINAGGYGQVVPTKLWTVVLGARRNATDPPPSIGYQIVDSSGRPIRYVDKEGNPVSELKVVSESDVNGPGNYFGGRLSPEYPQAYFNVRGPATPDVLTASTNVNPKFIAKLRLSATRSKRVMITGFPLDPK